ncbi:MAG: ABC transporter ATP-binding protein [Hyphomicrobiaceae bacterium]
MSSLIEVNGLTRVYTSSGLGGGVRDAEFALDAGTFFTLLGPSGCGKTTTLRCIAGLERPDVGRIRVADEVFFDSQRNISVPLNERRLGMVFQSYAIWPHMTVFDNVAFPLRVAKDRRFSTQEIERDVQQALDAVNLTGFEKRSATQLSGGQQQRVALARAIVRRPKVLLLDEPLSNLDASLREEMRKELKRLQKQIGITTIYVTHDQVEALELSDQIAVLDHGRIVQMGAPRELYFHPRNAFVAEFIGSTNIFRGVIAQLGRETQEGIVKLGDDTVLKCTLPTTSSLGDNVVVSVRPESIVLSEVGKSSDGAQVNKLEGTIVLSAFSGASNRYTVQTSQSTVTVFADAQSTQEIGSKVTLEFKAANALAIAI